MPKKPSKSAVVIDINKWVTNLVGGSVEDAKCYLQLLDPENAHGIETNLVILRTALEAEKEGAARKSLITAIRAAIRTNENALVVCEYGDAPTDDGLPRVYGADANAGDEGDPSTEEMAGVDLLVALIVGGTVAEAKRQLVRLSPPTGASAEKVMASLRILRAALEAEERGPNRSSLVSEIRAEILHIEKAIADNAAEADEVDGSPMVHLRFAPKSAFAHHPRLADIPMPGAVADYLAKQKDDRADAWREDIAAFRSGVNLHGIVEPLKVVPCPPLLTGEDDGIRWWVVDGRTRLDSAPENEEIPFVEVDPDDVDDIIETTVSGRRNWTKGQKAYLAVCRHPEVMEVGRGNPQFRTECGIGSTDEPSGLSAESLASRFGVSVRLIEQAIALVREMDNLRGGYPAKVEAAEMEVWAGTGLAAVLSGLKGYASTAGKTKPNPVASAAADGLRKLAKATKNFGEWTQPQVMAFRDEAQKFWHSLDTQAAEFLIWVHAHHNDRIEQIIAMHQPAEEGGAE